MLFRSRPKFTVDTPQFYRDLMEKCWHSDPHQRPIAQEIHNLTFKWHFSRTQEITDQINKAEEIRKQNVGIKKETKTPHPGAIYISRLMTNITHGKQFIISLYKF